MDGTLIYCKVEDIQVDSEGNVYLIFSKEREETLKESIKRLKTWIGKDACLLITEMEGRTRT